MVGNGVANGCYSAKRRSVATHVGLMSAPTIVATTLSVLVSITETVLEMIPQWMALQASGSWPEKKTVRAVTILDGFSAASCDL